MSARTASPPRVFTRADGRDRVSVPLWNGVLSAVAAIAIAFVLAIAGAILLTIVIVLITGNTPSVKPGHPFESAIETIMYAAGGWFAWRRLRTTGRNPFRALTRPDARIILIGVAALVAVRIGTAIQLILTNQTKHVQSGFEHFDVVTQTPAITALAVTLTILTSVILAPLVEEIIFRGLLFGALAKPLGVLASAAITAVAFGAAHGDPILFPTLAALGFITALAYAATGNLWVPITLHALSNAIATTLIITTSLLHH